jgi:hypothetical protein
MRGLSLERPPRWGLIALVLLVAANVALFVLLEDRSDQVVSQADEPPAIAAVASTPIRPSPTGPTAPSAPPILAVYGDGYAAGNSQGGVGPAGWPALVARQVGATLALHAAPQAGYASVGARGQDYRGLVQASPVPDASVTLLFGSRNDRGEDVTAVEVNAAQVINTVRTQSSTTAIVVIGPVWDDGDVPADVLATRDAVQTAAEAASVSFVDPLREGWFADEQGLISPDGISPNDQGHRYLAGLISPVVEQVLTGLDP